MHWPAVGAWLAIHAWASTSQFLPPNSTASKSLVVVNMQMDAHLKKEQIGTLFVRVGALGGGPGGRVVPQGGPAQKYTCLPSKKDCSLLPERLSYCLSDWHQVWIPCLNTSHACFNQNKKNQTLPIKLRTPCCIQFEVSMIGHDATIALSWADRSF